MAILESYNAKDIMTIERRLRKGDSYDFCQGLSEDTYSGIHGGVVDFSGNFIIDMDKTSKVADNT